MTRFFVKPDGSYIGGFDGAGALALVPADAIEVPAPPEDARQVWNGGAWGPKPAAPKRVDLDQLAARLVAKGVLSAADLDAAKV